MPRNRPSGIPWPDSFAPRSNAMTIAGSIIRARPVPTSTTAAKARIFARLLGLASLMVPESIDADQQGSREHAALEHLVGDGCGNPVDEGHPRLRVVAQEFQAPPSPSPIAARSSAASIARRSTSGTSGSPCRPRNPAACPGRGRPPRRRQPRPQPTLLLRLICSCCAPHHVESSSVRIRSRVIKSRP